MTECNCFLILYERDEILYWQKYGETSEAYRENILGERVTGVRGREAWADTRKNSHRFCCFPRETIRRVHNLLW